MARIFKCDFCLDIIEDENNIYDLNLMGDNFDLCEQCYDKILLLKDEKFSEYTVEETANKLNVSKVTIYAKLKKFDDMVVLKQGKKYVTKELLHLIKKDLRVC